MQVHFDAVKAMLVQACMLSHPDPSAPLALTADASKYAIGGTVEQFVNNRWEPLGYWSRHLKDNQKAWTCFRRELYAIQQAIRHFLAEIKGRNDLVVYTDHMPIVQLAKSRKLPEFDPVALRQMVEISHWCTDIRHRPGKANIPSDQLSILVFHNFLISPV